MQFIPYASSSRGNFYQVAAAGTRLLLECGIPIWEIKRYLNFDLSRIDGCLLTHAHKDHAKAAKEITALGIDLYCSAGTIKALGLSGHRVHPIKAMEQFSIGQWTILPFEIEHDAPEPLGFLIANQDSKLLFVTDTYFIRYRFSGLTHIAVECNWDEQFLPPDFEFALKKRLLESHMSLHTLKSFFAANDLKNVQEIHLLHLSDGNSCSEYFKTEIQALTGIPVYVAPKKQ